MKFAIDLPLTEKLEKQEDIEKQAYANFCMRYVDQIKNKLDYKIEKMTIKQQIYIKDKNGTKKLVTENVKVFRCSMEMVNPSTRKFKRHKLVKTKPKSKGNQVPKEKTDGS